MRILKLVKSSVFTNIKSRYLIYYIIYGFFHGCYYATVVGAVVK